MVEWVSYFDSLNGIAPECGLKPQASRLRNGEAGCNSGEA